VLPAAGDEGSSLSIVNFQHTTTAAGQSSAVCAEGKGELTIRASRDGEPVRVAQSLDVVPLPLSLFYRAVVKCLLGTDNVVVEPLVVRSGDPLAVERRLGPSRLLICYSATLYSEVALLLCPPQLPGRA
jgi:hypothetical protein